MKLRLRNIFCKSNPAIVKLSLALRTFIGTISTAVFISDKPALAFYLLVAGALIDLFLQMLPENAKTPTGPKTLFLIGWLIATTLLLSGCKVLRPGSERSVVDTTYITYKTVETAVKGAEVKQSVDLDSLLKNLIPSLTKGDGTKNTPTKPVVVTDPKTKAQLTYWVDEYGKLQLYCESKDQTIQMLVAETNRLRKDTQKTTEVIFKTPVWCWIVISALATLLLISMLIIVFKNLLK